MNIVVYCGASEGKNENYQLAARTLGQWIAEQGHTLIYGGGKVGLMGKIADAVLASGGQVVGVIPTFLKEREIAHPHLSELHVVKDMSERKQKMLALGDACIALPGGPGTLEEIIEAVSWARVGQNENPCIFYNVNGYYQGIQAFFDLMVMEQFLTVKDRKKILFAEEISEIENFIINDEALAIQRHS